MQSTSLKQAKSLASALTPEQMKFWADHDYILIPSFFSKADVEKMRGWVEDIAKWPLAEGKYLNYFEMIDGKPYISRTENFLPYHPEFKALIESSGIFEIVETILGEPVVLFKEKINYKYPGTGEYPPHQDVHAFETSPLAFQPYHRNVTIFLDDATIENGCMELGWGYEKNKVLGRFPTGAIYEEEVQKLDWRPLPCPAGSLFVFDMFWPHRSAVNNSPDPRRSIFMTFNGISKGDLRAAHYADRASGKAKSREIKSNLVVQTNLPKAAS
ncbi:MAG: phytanoyl-CoA dioxygenase family protein [Rhodospirillaceae bacterium]|nr:phytanoyl-CoA dioxygenase family protein [Rhodospirillaceae bacterium]